MRIRDFVQLGKNLAGTVRIEWQPTGFPKLIISFKDLWNLYQNPMTAHRIVAIGFASHEILWVSWKDELRHRPEREHRQILDHSLEVLGEKLNDVLKSVTGSSGEDVWLRDVLQYLAIRTSDARRGLAAVVSCEDYNAQNAGAGPDSESRGPEKTPKEETAELLVVVKELRKDTLRIWDSLIDFLPDGHIETDARGKMAVGMASVGLSPYDMEQPWKVAEPT
jgi:hypothetical protein